MPPTLHIVEPTLVNDAGHCRGFVETLCCAGGDPGAFRVWAARGAVLPGLERIGVPIERFFHRRVRRLEQFSLLRRLLRGPDRIVISTAGRTDLMLLDWAAPGPLAPRKAFAYVHWVRATPRKLAALRRIARRQPELVVLGPTRGVVDVLRDAGFRHHAVVPYPTAPLAGAPAGVSRFRHVVVAGAAREDKGFSHVVALVELLAARGSDLPVVLQTSIDPNDRRAAAVGAAVSRLAGAGYAGLQLLPETLDPRTYAEQFPGAICLQPYDPVEFADRVSGVTLDALSVGAPVVTVPGTWMARIVERFGAGAVAASAEPGDLLAAVDQVRAEYVRYHDAALRAGETLRREHDGRHLLEVLTA